MCVRDDGADARCMCVVCMLQEAHHVFCAAESGVARVCARAGEQTAAQLSVRRLHARARARGLPATHPSCTRAPLRCAPDQSRRSGNTRTHTPASEQAWCACALAARCRVRRALRSQFAFSSKLLGFRSRCSTFAEWMYFRPRSSCLRCAAKGARQRMNGSIQGALGDTWYRKYCTWSSAGRQAHTGEPAMPLVPADSARTRLTAVARSE
jgi:hypothetical protein